MLRQSHSYCRRTVLITFFLSIIWGTKIVAQPSDSGSCIVSEAVLPILTIDKQYQSGSGFQFRSLIIPTTLISYGFVALQSEELKDFDNHLKEEIWT